MLPAVPVRPVQRVPLRVVQSGGHIVRDVPHPVFRDAALIKSVSFRHGQLDGVRAGPVGQERAQGRCVSEIHPLNAGQNIDGIAVFVRHGDCFLERRKGGEAPGLPVVEGIGGARQPFSLEAVGLRGTVNARQRSRARDGIEFPRHGVAHGLGRSADLPAAVFARTAGQGERKDAEEQGLRKGSQPGARVMHSFHLFHISSPESSVRLQFFIFPILYHIGRRSARGRDDL